MIRVELGEEYKRRGTWFYSVPGMGIEGRSRQPLLDACRVIQRMGGDSAERVGLFRQGRSEPDISCTVEDGARLTVREDPSPHFEMWRPMPELVEVEPGRWRMRREPRPPARSDLPCPAVISDIMPPTEQVNGQFYTSKRAFRAVGRELGLIEVGNEKPKPRPRATDAPAVKQQRREAVQRAVARYRAGERPANK
jgi:hypothetical protein